MATVIIVIAGAAILGPSALAPGAAVVAKANESNSKKREVAPASPNPREPFKSPIINAPLSSKPLVSREVRNFTSKDVIEALPTFQYTAPPTPAVSDTFNVYAIPTEAPSPVVQETFKLSHPPSSSPNYVDLKSLPPMQATLPTYEALPHVFKGPIPSGLTYQDFGSSLSLNSLPSKFSYSSDSERALATGHFNQVIQDLGKGIEKDPKNPHLYLERGFANFSLGKYDASIDDYREFLAKTPKTYPLSIPEFSWGFAKGLPKGIYESGEGLALFLTDLVKHPVNTGGQMWEALTQLSKLVRTEQWSAISQTLVPEIHQLVLEWDTLPSLERGELAGFAFGKYGSDILIPGALVKATSLGLKGAKELGVICKGLQNAEKTLLLESAATLGQGSVSTSV